MFTARCGDITTLPCQWEHDLALEDNDGWTVAMHAAHHGSIPRLPSRWEHDPTLKNNDGDTVAIIANRIGYDVPDQWLVRYKYNYI